MRCTATGSALELFAVKDQVIGKGGSEKGDKETDICHVEVSHPPYADEGTAQQKEKKRGNTAIGWD
jgi:hypothetical protein